ncbi:hypothetical protein HI914_06304 [Erysiphe necator]|nr:hypothetical protein HI914_06304 [Erysiphe necator]
MSWNRLILFGDWIIYDVSKLSYDTQVTDSLSKLGPILMRIYDIFNFALQNSIWKKQGRSMRQDPILIRKYIELKEINDFSPLFGVTIYQFATNGMNRMYINNLASNHF